MRETTAVLCAALAALAAPSAHAAWTVEKIAVRQFRSLLISDAQKSGSSRLYGAGEGSRHGVITSFSYSDQGWESQAEITKGSFAPTFAFGSDCGPSYDLFVGSNDVSMAKYKLDGGEWRESFKWAGLGNEERLAGRTRFGVRDVQTIKTVELGNIRIIVPPSIDAPEFKCKKTPWARDIVEIGAVVVGKTIRGFDDPSLPRFYKILAVGDARGDGVRRFYGSLHRSGENFELEKVGAKWHIKEFSSPTAFPAGKMLITKARNDKRPALYADGLFIYEHLWNSQSWTTTRIGNPGIKKGFVVGRFRDDDSQRLYTTDREDIVEMTHHEDGWRVETIPVHKGIIAALVGGQVGSAQKSLYMSILNQKGIYRMSWREGWRVAVTAFKHNGVPSNDARRITDHLAIKLVETGNCTVVEREKIETIVREHKLQVEGLLSREHAVRLGKIIGADKVVVGSVGKLYGTYVAAVKVVSVKTGLIDSSEYYQWRSDEEFGRLVEGLGVAVCPSNQAAR